MPIPKKALSTNCGLDRCARRTASSTAAAVTLASTAVRRSWPTRNTAVNRAVGTAASSMPRPPPSAVDSWCRTAASTVAVGVDGVDGVGSATVTTGARSAGCR